MASQIIEDTDPSIIYSNGWTIGTEFDTGVQSTVHRTWQAGARLRVPFEGISIEVYGTARFSSPFLQYSIDGTSVSTDDPLQAVGTGDGGLLFRSPILSGGKHSLLVELLSDKIVSVDYFMVTAEDQTTRNPEPSTTQQKSTQTTHTTTEEKTSISTISSSTIFPTSSPALSLSSIISRLNQTVSTSTISSSSPSPTSQPRLRVTTTPTVIDPPSKSQPPPATPPSNHQLPLGAIIGIAIACVLVVVLVCFIFWCYRRRWARNAEFPPQRPTLSMKTSDVTPFVLPEVSYLFPWQYSLSDPMSKRPLIGPESISSPVFHPLGLTDRNNVDGTRPVDSAVNSGRTREALSQGSDTAVHTRNLSTAPQTPKGYTRIQEPFLYALVGEGNLVMIDNLPPPAYSRTP